MRKFYHWITLIAFETARETIDTASGYPDGITTSIWATGATVAKDINGRPIFSLSDTEQEHEHTAPVLAQALIDEDVAEITEGQYWTLINEANPGGDG